MNDADKDSGADLTEKERELVAAIVQEKPWRGLIYHTSYPFRYLSAFITTAVLCVTLKPSFIEGIVFIILSIVFDYLYYRLASTWMRSDLLLTRKILLGEKLQSIPKLRRTIGNQVYSIYLTVIIVSLYFFLKTRGGMNIGQKYVLDFIWTICMLSTCYLKLFSFSKYFPDEKEVNNGEFFKINRDAYSAIRFGYAVFVRYFYFIGVLILFTAVTLFLLYGVSEETFSLKGKLLMGVILTLFVNFFARVNFACKAHHIVKRIEQRL